MQEYVIELSKYFIALFMVLYTGSCFYTFRYPVGEYSKGIFILQNILMFLVQVLCFLDLSLTGGDLQYLFFFAFILIFLFATITMVSLIRESHGTGRDRRRHEQPVHRGLRYFDCYFRIHIC